MLRNRHPFRVGPVRAAYWESLRPIITFRSVLGCGGETGGGVRYRVPAIRLLFQCSRPAPVTSAATEQTACAITTLNHFSMPSHSYMCVNRKKRNENNKPCRVSQVKGTASESHSSTAGPLKPRNMRLIGISQSRSHEVLKGRLQVIFLYKVNNSIHQYKSPATYCN